MGSLILSVVALVVSIAALVYTEFRTLAYLDYEEMRGYMYGMLESYRHYKPLIMGAIHA